MQVSDNITFSLLFYIYCKVCYFCNYFKKYAKVSFFTRVFIDKSYNFGLSNVKAVKMEEGCEPCQIPEYRSDVGLASFNLGQ